MYVKFVSVIILDGSLDGTLLLQNGKQDITTLLRLVFRLKISIKSSFSDLCGSICVFDQYQLASEVKLTRNDQTLSLCVSQTGRHELIISNVKITVDLLRAFGEREIERLESELSKT